MLPNFQNNDRDFQLMQTAWSKQLNPLLKNPANNSIILKNVQLTSGLNSIDTKLGQKLTGWVIIRQRGAASIYDDQDNNPNPQLTLWLQSSASVSVDIEVF